MEKTRAMCDVGEAVREAGRGHASTQSTAAHPNPVVLQV